MSWARSNLHSSQLLHVRAYASSCQWYSTAKLIVTQLPLPHLLVSRYLFCCCRQGCNFYYTFVCFFQVSYGIPHQSLFILVVFCVPLQIGFVSTSQMFGPEVYLNEDYSAPMMVWPSPAAAVQTADDYEDYVVWLRMKYFATSLRLRVRSSKMCLFCLQHHCSRYAPASVQLSVKIQSTSW